MGAAFVIMLREGLEAALLISIILAYLNGIGRRDGHRVVWMGVVAAVVASLASGGIIFAIAGGLSHRASEVFEGIASYAAVAVLTWMVFWMRRNAIKLKGALQGRVDLALAGGSMAPLGLLAFVVVVREGLESALFLFSAFRAGAETPGALRLLGALLGLGVASGLGVLFYRGGIKLNLRLFFRITGVLILLVAASLLIYGTHELLEVGAFGFLAGTGLLAEAPGIAGIMSLLLKLLVGLGGHPTWLEFGLWLAYVAVAGWLFFRPMKLPATPAPAAAASPRT